MERYHSKGRRVSLVLFLAAGLAAVLALTAVVAPARALDLTPVAYLPLAGNGSFSAPPTATPTPTVTPPGPTPTSGPYDQLHLAWTADTATTLTVAWRTWEAGTDSAVMYRRAGAVNWQTATGRVRRSGTEGKLHEVTLTGLQPATSYEYRVRTDKGGWSPIHTTRTAPSGPSNFDAVFIADTGIVGRLDRLATGTEQIIDEVKKLDPLLILGGGDYAYFDKDKRFGTLDATIDAWFNQMMPVAARAPLMPAYGNHEADPEREETGPDPNDPVWPWNSRFPTPPQSGLGSYDYSFDVGDVHFISIYAALDYKAVSDAQLAWLENDMAAAKARGMRWLVPYFHVPIFGDGTNHGPNTWLRERLGPVLERHGVKLVFVAHDQSYERSFPLTDVPNTNRVTSSSLSCYTPSDGVVYVKVSPSGKESNISGSFSPFKSKEKPYWTAVRDNTMHHYARIRVSAGGSIRVEAFGAKGDGSAPVLQDSFKITLGACP
jgi:acid phosphatase type 7